MASSDLQPDSETLDLPLPPIPFYVFVVSGLLVGVLLGTQLLGLWLTGFRRPVAVRDYEIGGGRLK